MRTLPEFLLVSACLLVVSCGGSESEENESGSAGASAPYRKVVEDGLSLSFNYLAIPLGKVKVWSGVNPNANLGSDKEFFAKYLETLNLFRDKGLIELKEEKQATGDSVSIPAVRTFTVTALPLAIENRDPSRSDDEWLRIQLATCDLLEIVKDVQIVAPSHPVDDHVRLVEGIYEASPTSIGARVDEVNAVKRQFRFRALVKVNVPARSYEFQGADWGRMDEEGWATRNIRE